MSGKQLEKKNLAGEDLIPDANSISTQSIQIDAEAKFVWPWLLQMGHDRGGFYSYTWLENLAGCQMKNAEQINPKWQSLNLRDEVSMHPRAPKLQVAQIVPESCLVLIQKKGLLWSWSFNLFEEKQTCLMVVRTRIRWQRLWTRFSLGFFMKFGHYIMERKMLSGIKQRSERLAKN